MSDRRGRFTHHQCAGAEALDDEAKRRQFRRMRVDQRRRVGIEIDDERGQKRLPLDSARLSLTLEPLIDDALMRRVLVDDDHAVLRLGDDVVLVHLRARRAEGSGEVSLVRPSRRGAGAEGAASAKLACAGSASRGAAGEARQSQRGE